MKLIPICLTLIYCFLILYALFHTKVQKIPAVFMGGGCFLNVLYLFVRTLGNFSLLLIAGMVCISVGALVNGYLQKNLHIAHHLIRASVELVIIFLFLLL